MCVLYQLVKESFSTLLQHLTKNWSQMANCSPTTTQQQQQQSGNANKFESSSSSFREICLRCLQECLFWMDHPMLRNTRSYFHTKLKQWLIISNRHFCCCRCCCCCCYCCCWWWCWRWCCWCLESFLMVKNHWLLLFLILIVLRFVQNQHFTSNITI